MMTVQTHATETAPTMDCNNSKEESPTLLYSIAEEMNPSYRPHMEDIHLVNPAGTWGSSRFHFVGICDGHGGRATVDFLQTTLLNNLAIELKEADPEMSILQVLQQAILVTDIQGYLYGIRGSGSTLAICLIDKHSNQLHVANVGDARIVMGSCTSSSSTPSATKKSCDENKKTLNNNNTTTTSATRLTHDHRVSDIQETNRILNQEGGLIVRQRVMGILAVARSMGDYGLKRYVTAQPNVETFQYNNNKKDFLIVACDGLWDVLSDDEAVQLVEEYMMEGASTKETMDHESSTTVSSRYEKAASILTQAALERGTTDNVTVVVCWL